ncbi:hypothetical protein B5M42_001355 [Paenibacillus athensensis]|uniref:Uncharacterized protein n=1 Tax=Paenibacillus athensensis TaxID=1967502 RepID=A0A4Y8QC18_9BACL|nr:hypothetical protein [Paenibacillus athensensis]MCD1257484.1 hypothetical protein [Paenibacillus athensensis]
MFDPTIYDNMKVVLEGAVYDLDMEGAILVTQRCDRIDLSSMSRHYAIEFACGPEQPSRARIELYAHLNDLAAEIMEHPGAAPGCTMEVRFTTPVREPQRECPDIARRLQLIWGNRPSIEQRLSFAYAEAQALTPASYVNDIRLQFGRKVDESHIGDLPELLDCAAQSLLMLDRREG